MMVTRKCQRGCKVVVSEMRFDQKLTKSKIIFSCTWQLSGSRPLGKRNDTKQIVVKRISRAMGKIIRFMPRLCCSEND